MSKIINIEIEDEVLDSLSKIENKDLDTSIKEIIIRYIEKRVEHKNDPIFNLGVPVKSGFSDISRTHDKYIYNKR